MKRSSVLVVDDSAVMRQVASSLITSDSSLELIAAVGDPLIATERMRKQWPDVIVLDVEMPRMDGITFLRKIMAERPTPVVICSTLTQTGAETSVAALAAGAVAVIGKPKLGLKDFLQDSAEDFLNVIRTAAHARVRRPAVPAPVARPRHNADVILGPELTESPLRTTDKVVAMGTSTGGTQALEQVLVELPVDCPGIVIVQHMPEKFTAAFAARLDSVCAIRVREARNHDQVTPGLALIAPGGKHLLLKRNGARYHVEVMDGPLVNRHKPSVDVLFRSVAKAAGQNAIGLIMTGMGDDGAAGLLEMRRSGARTLAQDEQTSVVYGMPKEAVKRGAVELSLPLDAIAREVLRLVS